MRENRRHVIGMLLLCFLIAASALQMGCDKEVHVYVGAKFRVTNSTGYALHVYLDAIYQCSVDANGEAQVEDLDEGEYDAEARLQSDGSLVKSQQVYLEAGETFWWVIDS